MFDWNDIRAFLAVARSRKIAPAAQQLGVDPTTLVRRLDRLEQAIGTSLFEVGSGGRVMTERGHALLAHAETIESAALSAMEELSGQAHSLSGQVRLSVAEGLGTWILSPAMRDFRERHPRIRLDLITASGFLNPSKREADMALMLARPRTGRLFVRRLGDYKLHLYAAPAYLATNEPPRDPASLRRHTLVGYVPDFIFSPELDYLNEVHAGLEADLRATSINMQYRMIAEGAGIGVLPDFIAQQDSRLVRVMPQEVEIGRSFWLVIHEDIRKLPRIDAVAEWLGERVASIGGTA